MADRRPRVLVVEDEASVRLITERMLVLAGYDVVCCATADEARAAIASDGGATDVLLSDIHVGDTNGHDLAAEVRRIRPAIGVILMSGYTQAEAAAAGMAPGTLFLGKPFNRAALAAAVDAALRARPPAEG
jgi:DNA-binding NtrC family response regulator